MKRRLAECLGQRALPAHERRHGTLAQLVTQPAGLPQQARDAQGRACIRERCDSAQGSSPNHAPDEEAFLTLPDRRRLRDFDFREKRGRTLAQLDVLTLIVLQLVWKEASRCSGVGCARPTSTTVFAGPGVTMQGRWRARAHPSYIRFSPKLETGPLPRPLPRPRPRNIAPYPSGPRAPAHAPMNAIASLRWHRIHTG